MKKTILYLLSVLVCYQVNGQQKNLNTLLQQKVDSLSQLVRQATDDTTRINLNNQIAFEYLNEQPEKALEIYKKSLREAEKAKFMRGKVIALLGIGDFYDLAADYNTSVEYYRQTLLIATEYQFYKEASEAAAYMGFSYSQNDKYDLAIRYGMEAIRLGEQGYLLGAARGYNTIGNVYTTLKKHDLAVENFQKALAITEKIGNKPYRNTIMGNLALSYEAQKNYTKALELQLECMKENQAIQNYYGLAVNYTNIGVNYEGLKEYKKALEFHQKALAIDQKLGNQDGITTDLNEIGKIYTHLKDYAKALEYQHKSLEMATANGFKTRVYEAAASLAKTYEALNDYPTALRYEQLYAATKDSLFNEKISKQIADLQAHLNLEGKQKEIDVLSQTAEQKDLQLKAQQERAYWLIAGLIFVIFMGGLFYNRYKVNQKLNKELLQKNNEIHKQNLEIQSQKAELEQKNLQIVQQNKDMLNSIQYGKRIQAAMLPFEDRIARTLGAKNYFILYKPRDIVSGDFYWFEEYNQDKLIIAVGDCTGHGIPGAFMSMIATQILSETVFSRHIIQPDLVLNLLHKEVRRVLKQRETDRNEGMDIAYTVLHKNQQSNFELLEYAGAMNPLYICRLGELEVIEATKKPIGGGSTRYELGERYFDMKAITLNPDIETNIYYCSDGYQDQFGGKEKRKFLSKNLKNLLLNNAPLQMYEQQVILDNTITEWTKTGGERQTDDITIFGIRVGES